MASIPKGMGWTEYKKLRDKEKDKDKDASVRLESVRVSSTDTIPKGMGWTEYKVLKDFQQGADMPAPSFSDYQTEMKDYSSRLVGYKSVTDLAQHRSRVDNMLNEALMTREYYARNQSVYDLLYGEGATEKVLVTLDSSLQHLKKVRDDIDRQITYYSQWDTEDAYKRDYARSRRLSNIDLPSAQTEISELEKQVAPLKSTSKTMPWMVSSQQRQQIDDTQKAIDRRRTDYKAAEQLQRDTRYDAVLHAPDLKEYVKKGATAENNVLNKKLDIGKIGTQALKQTMGGPLLVDPLATATPSALFMNDDERKTYLYLLGKDNEKGTNDAEQYLNYLSDTLNQREGAVRAKAIKGAAPAEITHQLAANIERGISGTGRALGIDIPYSPAEYATHGVQENLREQGWLADLLGDIAAVTGNMAPSLVLSYLGLPIAGIGMLTASAGGNLYKEAIDAGYSKEQAETYAILGGALEGGLQYLLGGISALGGKLGGKLTGKAIGKVVKNVDRSLLRIAGELVGKGLSEGTEEYLQEILNPVLRNMTLGENNEFKVFTPEAAYSFLLGAITAGILEGPSTIGGHFSAQESGRAVMQAEKYDDLIEHALALNEKTKSHQMAKQMQSGELHANARNVGELIEQYRGDGGDLSFMYVPNETYAGKAAEEEVIDEAAEPVLEQQEEPDLASQPVTDETPQEAVERPVTEIEPEEGDSALEPVEAEKGPLQQPRTDVAQEGVAAVKKNDQSEVVVTGLKTIKNGKAYVELADGRTVALDAVEIQNENYRELYDAARHFDHETARVFVQHYDEGITWADYFLGFYNVYQAGRKGIGYDKAVTINNDAQQLVEFSEAAAMAAHVAGMSSIKVEPETRHKTDEGTREYYNKVKKFLQSSRVRLTSTQLNEVAHAFDRYGNYRNKLMGMVQLTRADNAVDLDAAWQELSDAFPDLFPADTNEGEMPYVLLKAVETIRQHTKKKTVTEKPARSGVVRKFKKTITLAQDAQIKAIDAVFKAISRTVVIEDKITAVQGQQIPNAPNAYFDPATNEYHIALNSIGQAYMYFAVHESVHDISTNNPLGYDVLETVVLDILREKGTDVDALIEAQRKLHPDKDEAYWREEVVANTVPVILTDKDTGKEFALRFAYEDAEAQSAFQKLLDAIKALLQKAYDVLKKQKSWRQMEAVKGDIAAIDAIRDVYLSALEEVAWMDVPGGDELLLSLQDGKKSAVYNIKDGKPQFSLKDPVDPMYSKLQQVLDEYKGDKIAVSGLIPYLSGKGVKAEEIKWSGIEQFTEGKKSVTKAELAEFLAGNSLEIRDVDFRSDNREYLEYMDWAENEAVDLSEDRENEIITVRSNDNIFEYYEDEDGTWSLHDDAGNILDSGGESYEDALRAAEELVDSVREYWMREYPDIPRGESQTRYNTEELKIPGGENYREVLFTLPGVQADYETAHWDERNVVAHTRLQDFKDADGAPVLFVEEVQSDWHQEGREKGYAQKPELTIGKYQKQDNGVDIAEVRDKNDNLVAWVMPRNVDGKPIYVVDMSNGARLGTYNNEQKALDAIATKEAYRFGEVPDAPFRDTWHQYVMKRVLRMAAEGDYKYVAWTTGQMQADRYNLSKHVLELAYWREGDEYGISAVDHNDQTILEQEFYSPTGLAHTFGKEVADKIINDEGYSESKSGFQDSPEVKYLSGDGLSIGGEGMKAFYDIGGKSSQNIPRFMKKYVKQWGSRVQEVALDGGLTVPAVEVTDAMKKDVLYKGQPRFSVKDYSLQRTQNIAQRQELSRKYSEAKAKNAVEEMARIRNEYKALVEEGTALLRKQRADKALIVTHPEKQEIKSADTSINKTRLPAVFGRVKWEPGTVNLDLGGGKFDNATEYLAGLGVTNHIYDPYNRSEEHNAAAAAATQEGQADTVTVSNVLNTIKEQEARDQVLANAVDAVKPDGKVYITVYAGDGTGRGGRTPKGWQENRPLSSYMKEVRKFFDKVEVKNNTITATQPKKEVAKKFQRVEGEAGWTAQRVGEPKKPMPASDIVEMIRHDFKIPVTVGHIRDKHIVRGKYLTHAEVIRTREANALPVIAHELGHHLDKKYNITAKLNADLQNELTRPLPDEFVENYTRDELVAEGFAEYVRQYTQNRELAAKDYPLFTKHFTETLDPDALNLLNKHADEINAHYALDTETAQSSIRLREEGKRDFRTVRERMRDIADWLYSLWVDSNRGIWRFDKETGATTYKLAINSAYADAVAYNILTGDLYTPDGQRVSDGLFRILKPIKLNDVEEYTAFGEYLIVRHGPERLKEGMQVFANPAKNSVEWMNQRQAELEQQFAHFRDVADKLYQFERDFLKAWGVKTGLVNKKSVEMWAERWEYYVPFNRAVDIKRRTIGARRGFANQDSTIRRAKGSALDFIHPVDNIITNMVKMVNAGMRNRTMRAITSAANRIEGTAWFLEQVPAPMVRKEVKLTDVKDDLLDSLLSAGLTAEDRMKVSSVMESFDDILVQYEMGRAKGDVITVLREGKPEFWKINDELLLRSITNMKPATAEGVLAAYGRITRFMASSVTGNNIIWSLFSNFPRDLGSMFTYSETKNPIRLFGGVASAYLNKVKGADASALYKEFLAMGGGQTSAYTYDVNLAKKIRRKIGGAKLHWLNPLEWLEFVSNTVEAGPRFACYKIMRENGMSPEGAFYASTEITVNFRRGGTMARQMNKLVPFFNAGVQGLDRFRRWVTAADVPASTRKKAVAMRSMMYLTASAAIAAMVSSLNLGDDERRKEYATLSAYTKNNFWCIPLGDGKYFTIPKPREVAVLSSFIEACLEKVLVDENAMSTGYDHAMDGFYEYAVNAFLPSVLSDIAQGDIWGALGSFGIGGTLAYMMANRDFLGKPIVSSALERYEPKDRYTDRTSKIAHTIGQAFNVSPAMVDYFFQQTLGGFWKAQRALFPVGDEHVDYTLGVLNTYVRDSLYSTDVINKMYDRMEKTEQAKNSDPENIKKAIAYKEALNMTTFYSRYNKLAKGKPEDRDTRRAIIHMAHEFNKAAESGRRTYEQRQLDSICASVGDTELMPSVLQDTVKDSDGREYKLNAAQYVRYQTEYDSLYWRNVSVVLDNYGDEAAVKAAKDQAQDEAKAKLLKRLGVTDKLTERFDSMAEAGVDTSEYIQFKAALSTAREDGSLVKAEVLDALDEMSLDDTEREYLYDQQYSTAALTNPYRSYESLQEKINERRAEKADEGKDYTTIDRSIKSSLTNAYKDEVIRLYEAGDYEGIQEIIDKLSALDLHTRKGGPYYTYNYVWSWIHAYYHIPGTGAIYK